MVSFTQYVFGTYETVPYVQSQLFLLLQVSTTWTMLRIMFSDPANLTAPGLNHSHSKLGNLPLMNRYMSFYRKTLHSSSLYSDL